MIFHPHTVYKFLSDFANTPLKYKFRFMEILKSISYKNSKLYKHKPIQNIVATLKELMKV